MTRQAFYLMFALAASVAVIAAFGFFIKNENIETQSVSAKPPAAVNARTNGNRPVKIISDEQSSERQKFYCKDKEKLKIWKILKKTRYVKDQLQGETETGSCDEYIEAIKHLDFNDDGQNELYVISAPKIHPVSFAEIWIFQKIGGGYREILEERDENYKILKTKTGDFHDLYFVSRRTTHTQFLSIYKYKNGRYESAKCRVAVYYEQGKRPKLFDCNDERGIEKFENESRQITVKP